MSKLKRYLEYSENPNSPYVKDHLHIIKDCHVPGKDMTIKEATDRLNEYHFDIPQWMSVETDTPNDNSVVDIWSDGERITDMNFIDGHFGEWADNCTVFVPWEDDVTHWMHRPEPPK